MWLKKTVKSGVQVNDSLVAINLSELNVIKVDTKNWSTSGNSLK